MILDSQTRVAEVHFGARKREETDSCMLGWGGSRVRESWLLILMRMIKTELNQRILAAGGIKNWFPFKDEEEAWTQDTVIKMKYSIYLLRVLLSFIGSD